MSHKDLKTRFYLLGFSPKGLRRLLDYMLLGFVLMLDYVLIKAMQQPLVEASLVTRYTVYLVLSLIFVGIYFAIRPVSLILDEELGHIVLSSYGSLSRKQHLPLTQVHSISLVEGSRHTVLIKLKDGSERKLSLEDAEPFVASAQRVLGTSPC